MTIVITTKIVYNYPPIGIYAIYIYAYGSKQISITLTSIIPFDPE